MNFIKFRGDSNILSVEIVLPKEDDTGFVYYFPDGIEKRRGFKKKTYFVSKGSRYFSNLEEIVTGSDEHFIKSSKIWRKGYVKWTVKDYHIPQVFYFTDPEQLKQYLNRITIIDLSSYICLEHEKQITLYEYIQEMS